MPKIVDIVPPFPGWFARWRFTPEHTISYPVTVWAIVDEPDPSTRRAVVGVDASGQWPGATDNEPGADFVRCTRHLKRGDEHAMSNQVGGLLP